MTKRELDSLYLEYQTLCMELYERIDEINLNDPLPQDLDEKEKRMLFLRDLLESEGYF